MADRDDGSRKDSATSPGLDDVSKASVEMLVLSLETADDEQTVRIIKTLRGLGRAASAAAPALERIFDDQRQMLHVRLAALFALADIQAADEVRPDLQEELRAVWEPMGLGAPHPKKVAICQ